MSRIMPVICFGIGLICIGAYFHILSDVYEMFISSYVLTSYTAFGVIYTGDKYHAFMYMVFRLLPYILIGIGVLLLFFAGASAEKEDNAVVVTQ